MKKAVMYGAGNIGRGFIGKVFSESGYEVCFIDISPALIDEINRRGEYSVRIVSGDTSVDEPVRNVRAVSGLTEQAVDEIVTCDAMATAVGVNALPKLAPVIAKAAIARMERGLKPLDIILCENQLECDVLMRGWIYEHLNDEQRRWADDNLGLVEASIGRMVPSLPPELRALDPLLICVEPYADLPVDRHGFKGEIPQLKGLIPYAPFSYCIRRKLFIHNGGHAVCAYLGWQKGYKYIWQAIADPDVYDATRAFMLASAQALIAEFGESVRADVEANVDDLLARFGNKALGDTVARVGGDPARKLRRNDRIIGAALYCLEQGVDPAPIISVVKAALAFDNEADPTASKVQQALREGGAERVMAEFMGLTPDEPLYSMIADAVRGGN